MIDHSACRPHGGRIIDADRTDDVATIHGKDRKRRLSELPARHELIGIVEPANHFDVCAIAIRPEPGGRVGRRSCSEDGRRGSLSVLLGGFPMFAASDRHTIYVTMRGITDRKYRRV